LTYCLYYVKNEFMSDNPNQAPLHNQELPPESPTCGYLGKIASIGGEISLIVGGGVGMSEAASHVIGSDYHISIPVAVVAATGLVLGRRFSNGDFRRQK
jgi:hypothetical protein